MGSLPTYEIIIILKTGICTNIKKFRQGLKSLNYIRMPHIWYKFQELWLAISTKILEYELPIQQQKKKKNWIKTNYHIGDMCPGDK